MWNIVKNWSLPLLTAIIEFAYILIMISYASIIFKRTKPFYTEHWLLIYNFAEHFRELASKYIVNIKGSILTACLRALRKISKFHLMSWFGNIMETQFSQSFGWYTRKLCGSCAFPENFYTRKLGEITVFYAVEWDNIDLISSHPEVLYKKAVLNISQNLQQNA